VDAVRARPGFVLVVALLVVAVLTISSAAMLALGARESEISWALARRSAARLAAESATGWALADWSTRRYRELGPGETYGPLDFTVGAGQADPPAVAAAFSVRRLGTALYLVSGTGHVGGALPASGQAGALVRTVDPERLASGFQAAITADTEVRVQGGSVHGDQQCAPAGSAQGATPPAAPGVVAPQATIAPEATVTGAPPVLLADAPPVPGQELFVQPLLGEIATVVVTESTITPGPRTGPDGCEPDVQNWGAVSAASACHDHLPLITASTDLVVQGGEGRGLIVVDGDLTLEDVRFSGTILVRGRLTVRAGSVIRGALRADHVRIDASTVIYDSCHVITTLTAGGLDRPFRTGHRLWIPLF
jgi:hypothetical protein